MNPKGRGRWLVPLALTLAPLLALGACDQVQKVIAGLQRGGAPQSSGPAPLASVDIAARAMAGRLMPEDLRAATIAPEPVMFVPGEVLVGAKVEDKIVAMAPPALAASLKARFAAAGRPEPIDPALERAATEAAVADATKGARTVLDRLGVDATVSVNAGGILKIDLKPEKASPLQLATPAAGAPATPPAAGSPAAPGAPAAPAASTPAPAADAAPQAVVETGQKCPKGVTAAQLEADLVLKTQCTIERLKSARQFDYVEKNYVIPAVFDRIPWPGRKPPHVTPQPGAKTSPSAPPTAGPPSTGGQTGAAAPPTSAPPSGTPSAPASSAPPATPPPVTIAGLPDDPLLAFQWDLRSRGAGPGQAPGGAGFEDFWTKAGQTGSRNVRVAVIDTGVDKSHPDIAASPNIAPGIDLIADPERAGDGDGVDTDANDAGDKCGPTGTNSFHGTHVAGTIGAAITNDRKGVAAAAWSVTIVPVRAIGRCGGELEDIVNAIRWAAGLAPAQTAAGALVTNQNPADIINMSLSVGIACPASMQAAIDAAVARGVLVVVAAGNKASAVKNYAPANCANVIAVAAGDEQGRLAYYSNFGPQIGVLAPGGDVFQDADKDGRPDGILSTRTTAADCFDPQTGLPATNCFYSYLQGTSMAAPHVSAALALLKAQLGLSGQQLETAFFTRAVSPVDPTLCASSCDKNPGDGPLPGRPGLCVRECGRGALDLSMAAAQR